MMMMMICEMIKIHMPMMMMMIHMSMMCDDRMMMMMMITDIHLVHSIVPAL